LLVLRAAIAQNAPSIVKAMAGTSSGDLGLKAGGFGVRWGINLFTAVHNFTSSKIMVNMDILLSVE
jgi:hypothetical protein